jgi:hypothetical protein
MSGVSMPGRHQLSRSRRFGLRWLAGGAGAALLTATVLAFLPTASAGAAGDAVTATFSVTGVATSGCPVSVGGSDVYVKPGEDLDVSSSLTGIRLLGIGLNLGTYRGQLVIDPSASKPTTLMTDTKAQKVPRLSAGDHKFTWTVTNAAGVPLAVNLVSLGAGASLHYSGTIHVTNAKTKCGIAIQAPSVGASASVTGLPPVKVGVPGVKVTVVSDLPSLPHVPGLPGGGKSTGAKPPAKGTSSAPAVGGELPVPAQVVPRGGGALVLGNGGTGTGPQNAIGTTSGQLGGGTTGSGKTSAAAPVVQQDSTGKHKTIDLAASKASSTGQFSVILAIVAIIALSVVAATYARLYLLRRETN